VVVVLQYIIVSYSDFNDVWKTEVKVHTLGTGFWKTIEECPFGVVSIGQSGKFVSGTINWLATINFEENVHSLLFLLIWGKRLIERFCLLIVEGWMCAS